MCHFRPYLDYFLSEMSKVYNIVVFTAAYGEYAEKVLNKIDINARYIKNIISRDHCTKINNNFIKDFRVIANKGISKDDIVMLDNKVISYAYNIFQGVPILPYYDDPDDTELKNVVPFLVQLANKNNNIRSVLKERYNYNRFNPLVFPNSL